MASSRACCCAAVTPGLRVPLAALRSIHPRCTIFFTNGDAAELTPRHERQTPVVSHTTSAAAPEQSETAAASGAPVQVAIHAKNGALGRSKIKTEPLCGGNSPRIARVVRNSQAETSHLMRASDICSWSASVLCDCLSSTFWSEGHLDTNRNVGGQ